MHNAEMAEGRSIADAQVSFAILYISGLYARGHREYAMDIERAELRQASYGPQERQEITGYTLAYIPWIFGIGIL